VDYRWAESDVAQARGFLSEFVRANVNVIVTHATENVIAAKQATATIPIVFAVAADPVGTGLVASLARPGGNATGLSIQAPDLAGKRLSLLREVVPQLRRLGILFNAENPASIAERREVETAAHAMGLATTSTNIRQAQEVEPALTDLRNRVDALYGSADPILNGSRRTIASWSLNEGLPLIFDNREFVTAGALMSYGPIFRTCSGGRRNM
jgi:putative ABC transport system substrate-binding protein